MHLCRRQVVVVVIVVSVKSMSLVQSHVVVAVNHDTTAAGVPCLVRPHTPMSSQVILQANQHRFAKLALEDSCPPRYLAFALLVNPAAWSTAVAASASTPPMKLLQDVFAIAHKSRRLSHWIAAICLLTELALVGRNARDTSMLQDLKYAWLIPRRRIPWVFVKEESTGSHLLQI